ncbi:MAG: SDR family NAD(P)-dependent oxidoreductase [Planctomycetota bacterium]
MDTGLKDRGILITGASGGIGQAITRAFAAEGARLALHYHRHRQPVEQLQREIQAPSVIVQADLRDEHQVQGMFAEMLRALSRLDAIVVNAGIWNPHAVPLHEMTAQQWHETLEADLTSVFFTCRAFLKHIVEVPRSSASIVLVGSTAALFGEAEHADYAAAKAGMVYGLTRSLKNEIVRLAPGGRVNCVCPGWTDTPRTAAYTRDPAAVKRATATMALRKIAQSEDVATAIVFLTSEKLSGHISGAILPIAGGMEGRLLHP